jgi:c-di-GMP-binding flagellar brake protein YcgR
MPICRVETKTVLTSGGEVITPELIATLRRRGIEEVLFHLNDRHAFPEDVVPQNARQIDFHCLDVEEAPQAVREFLDRIIRNQPECPDLDRRVHKRHLFRVPILVVPVDEHLKPTGRPFQAFARDISMGGMSFLHTRDIPEKLVVTEIQIPEGKVKQLAMQLLRRRSVGRFYEIGGRWVAKLEA